MFQFLLELRGMFVSFFKTDLDWDRINQEDLHDEKLLEEFMEKVIKGGNKLYLSHMNTYRQNHKWLLIY
jgi:hypothetical protein